MKHPESETLKGKAETDPAAATYELLKRVLWGPARQGRSLVETAARRKALEVTGKVLARHLNADVSDHQDERLPCGCGH